jgi:hypothetical protein
VRHEIHGEVEGRDRQHGTHWEAADQAQPGAERRLGVETHQRTAFPARLFRGPAEGRRTTSGLDLGPLERLAALLRDHLGHFVDPLDQSLRDMRESLGARMNREFPGFIETGRRGRDRFLDVRFRGRAHLGDDLAVVGTLHFEALRAGSPLAGDEILLHLSHATSSTSSL